MGSVPVFVPIPRKSPTTVSRLEFSSIALMIPLSVSVALPTSMGLMYLQVLLKEYLLAFAIFAVSALRNAANSACVIVTTGAAVVVSTGAVVASASVGALGSVATSDSEGAVVAVSAAVVSSAKKSSIALSTCSGGTVSPAGLVAPVSSLPPQAAREKTSANAIRSAKSFFMVLISFLTLE